MYLYFKIVFHNFSYQGYLVGADVKLDCTNQILQKANFSVGYTVQDFSFHGLITNWGKQFSASIFQRITDRLHIAGSVSIILKFLFFFNHISCLFFP